MPQAIATGLFVSLCTIQAPTGNLGVTGAPDGTYADVSGLVNIPCIDAVFSPSSIQATEVKALQDIMASGFRHVLLNGSYDSIIAGTGVGWRAIVDNVTYDLLGAEPDSQTTQTRLHLRLVTV